MLRKIPDKANLGLHLGLRMSFPEVRVRSFAGQPASTLKSSSHHQAYLFENSK